MTLQRHIGIAMIVFDQIEAIDGWIIDQHQRVSDWVFGKWGVTPYQTSAQMFAAISLIHILLAGVQVSSGASFSFGLLFSGLVYSAMSFMRSVNKQKVWERTKLPLPPFRADIILRLNWLIITIFILLAGLLGRSLHSALPTFLVFALGAVTTWAHYFFACRPPTCTGRRRKVERGKPAFEQT